MMDLIDTGCVDNQLPKPKRSSKSVTFDKMVTSIANNFLDDPRDRTYYADTYRGWPPPMFMMSITLIELLYFIYFLGFEPDDQFHLILERDPFIYRPDKRNEFWRFAFYMVLHTGWTHLIFNTLIQLLIGIPLEMVHGSTRIGTIYMAGILAGSLGTSIFDPHVYLIGASGGVYALIAAHLANVVLNHNHMEHAFLRVFCVLAIASADVGFSVYERYLTGDESVRTSYVAHFTGALAGLTIGLVVLKNFEQNLHQQLVWWLAYSGYTICTTYAIFYNIL